MVSQLLSMLFIFNFTLFLLGKAKLSMVSFLSNIIFFLFQARFTKEILSAVSQLHPGYIEMAEANEENDNITDLGLIPDPERYTYYIEA